MVQQFFISDGGEAQGPYERSQLRTMWNTGEITSDLLYWNDAKQEWRSISELSLGEKEQPPAGRAEGRPSDSEKQPNTVRQWVAWLGGGGLLGGFLTGLSQSGGQPAVAFGMAIPIGLVFAGVGAVVGLIVKAAQKRQ
jgi:hypothetical protein